MWPKQASLLFACLTAAVLVHGNVDCPGRGGRGPRGFTGPAILPFTAVQTVQSTENPATGIIISTLDPVFIAFPTGPSGTVGNSYAIVPHYQYVTQTMAAMAFVTPYSGQVSNLFANVMYQTADNTTVEIHPVVIGNVTITVYKAAPSEPFVASSVSVDTTYRLGPAQGPLVDIALSDTEHTLAVDAGDRLVTLVTFYPFNVFPEGQHASTSFWISGSFEIS